TVGGSGRKPIAGAAFDSPGATPIRPRTATTETVVRAPVATKSTSASVGTGGAAGGLALSTDVPASAPGAESNAGDTVIPAAGVAGAEAAPNKPLAVDALLGTINGDPLFVADVLN